MKIVLLKSMTIFLYLVYVIFVEKLTNKPIMFASTIEVIVTQMFEFPSPYFSLKICTLTIPDKLLLLLHSIKYNKLCNLKQYFIMYDFIFPKLRSESEASTRVQLYTYYFILWFNYFNHPRLSLKITFRSEIF